MGMSRNPCILIIPLASIAIDRTEVDKLWVDICNKLSEYSRGINLIFFEPIIDERNLSSMINKIDTILKNCNGLILLHLTGGTSKLAIEILTNISNIRPFALFAHNLLNSLTSALNTRERLSQLLATEIYIPIIYQNYDLRTIIKMLYVADQALTKHDVLFFGPPVGIKIPINFRLIRGARLTSILEKAEDDEIQETLKSLENTIKIDYKGTEAEAKAISLYINLKRVIQNFFSKRKYEQFPLVCIECYYFMVKYKVAPCLAVSLLLRENILVACQRDVYSLYGMLILRLLTGNPVWNADLSAIDTEDNVAIFSHSCVNPLLGEEGGEAVYHPLTNLPYSMKIDRYKGGRVTIVSLDTLKEELHPFLGEILDYKIAQNKLETNQVAIKLLSKRVSELLEKTQRGHFLIVHGDWVKEINELSKILKQAKIIMMLKGM